MAKIEVDSSDLLKVYDALLGNEKFHVARDLMNSHVHLAPLARPSPLTSSTQAARERLEQIMVEAGHSPT